MFVETKKDGERTIAKSNPLTLESFASWLETRSGPYDFMCKKCAIGSYLIEHGLPMLTLGTETWTDADRHLHKLPEGWNSIAQTKPHSYEAAAERARAALAE